MLKVTFVLSLCLLFSVASFGIANVMEDGLVGFWAFDEGSGKTAADVTGNGHDGKFVGKLVNGIISQGRLMEKL